MRALEQAEEEVNPELRRALLTFVVAGGGFSGVECIAEMNDFLRETVQSYHNISERDLRLVLLQRGDCALVKQVDGQFSPPTAQHALRQAKTCAQNILASMRGTKKQVLMFTGLGKMENITKITGFFQSLGIPFPTLNAYLAGSTECFGGLCLLLGLGSRLITIPLIFTMIVAYSTAEREALFSMFSDPDKFTGADPFLFMMTAIIVFLFGPGFFSVDRLLNNIFSRKVERTLPASSLEPSITCDNKTA